MHYWPRPYGNTVASLPKATHILPIFLSETKFVQYIIYTTATFEGMYLRPAFM